MPSEDSFEPADWPAAVAEVLALFRARGGSRYGGEAITQAEHALQAAHFAEQEQASAALVAAALMHDLGHLLHDLPDDAPDHDVDDAHEALGAAWLESRFPTEVVEPVRLHVAAKRYLCAADPQYLARLSPPSLASLRLQGGAMNSSQAQAFQRHPHFHAAIRLRHWDEAAKIVGLATPSLEHFGRHLAAALRAPPPNARRQEH